MFVTNEDLIILEFMQYKAEAEYSNRFKSILCIVGGS